MKREQQTSLFPNVKSARDKMPSSRLLASPGEFAEKDQGCEARSGENAGIAGSIVEGLWDHGFRRHRDERPRSICLEDCRRVRAKVP